MHVIVKLVEEDDGSHADIVLQRFENILGGLVEIRINMQQEAIMLWQYKVR